MTQAFGTEAVEAVLDQAGLAGAPGGGGGGPDPEVAVRTLLAMAHLTPPEDEVADMVAGFRVARTAVRLLYAVPEARYDEPALRFSARV